MVDTLLSKARSGFSTLSVNNKYQDDALHNLEEWLTKEQYSEYVPQIEHLIDSRAWDYLLDSFYKVIPFGTGGRRGEVGIGPNRINPVTIRSSAQGHAQYLLRRYKEAAKSRGVVLGYDVRQFLGNSYLNASQASPVHNLTSRNLAFDAAEVYAGNGIKTYIFDGVRSTPELSFAIRHLGCVGGDVFSASHNPPTHNGKKVYDEFGGQLIPPHDEVLVNEVTQNVSTINRLPFEEAKAQGRIIIIGKEVDEAYIDAAAKTSLSDARDVTIVYSPLHGVGGTSVLKALRRLNFTVLEDPKTSNPSGAFENITFRIPNPEVVQSFETSLAYAKEQNADILLSSDPDADRMGIMVRHNEEWQFLNGNEIATILTNYAVSRMKPGGSGIVVKTVVTTDAVKTICERRGLKLIDGLLIGFKYIGDVMNELECKGDINNFLLGAEESHGYLTGNYARDKDAVTGTIWLSELAAELKGEGKTLIDYLDDIYRETGYYKNYLTEIRMLGASGNEKIRRIQATLRDTMPTAFGAYAVKDTADYQTNVPIVSETDRSAKDILVFWLEADDQIASIKVTIRPSGTEPKIKVYIEVGFRPDATHEGLRTIVSRSDAVVKDIEKAVLREMYKAVGVDFPDRGFLLFWQLPLDDKLRYFEIEPKIIALKEIPDKHVRQAKLDSLFGFLGASPTQKVNDAFADEYGMSIENYLGL